MSDVEPFWVEHRARRRRLHSWAAGLVVVGAGLDANALWNLRWAHLYRQENGEGLAFVAVFMQLSIATVLLVAASACLFAAGVNLRQVGERGRAWLRWSGAAVLVAVIVASWAVASWVESHGSDCIGPC